MKTKRSSGAVLGHTLVMILMWLYAIIVIFPMGWAIMSSLKSTKEFYANVWALPKTLYLENFVNAWKTADIGNNILNSLIIVSVTVVLSMILSAMIAYAITKFPFRGSKFIGKLFIMGLFVPLILGTIPEFLILQTLNLLDTRVGLILVYTAYSMPLSVFIMMGMYETISSTYTEAAYIDGCNNFQAFFKVILPLSRSGLVTISIFNFMWTWNDYIYAMTFLTSTSKRTLPVGLVKLTSMAMYKTDYGALFAGLVIVMLPSILVYVLFQNQLQAGMSAGGIKG